MTGVMMSWYASPSAIRARSLARRLGIPHLLSRVGRTRVYEDRFHEALVACLAPSDCVWDIGANIGYYADLFADRVGDAGCVAAFEPSPETFDRLVQNCGKRNNVVLHNLGIGAKDERLALRPGADELGATTQVAKPTGDPTSILVDVMSVESVVRAGLAPFPNIVKVDVEGYEPEVIQGMGSILVASDLRALGVEVHFGALEQRGMTQAPADIERQLTKAGFDVTWTDRSHLVAHRG